MRWREMERERWRKRKGEKLTVPLPPHTHTLLLLSPLLLFFLPSPRLSLSLSLVHSGWSQMMRRNVSEPQHETTSHASDVLFFGFVNLSCLRLDFACTFQIKKVQTDPLKPVFFFRAFSFSRKTLFFCFVLSAHLFLTPTHTHKLTPTHSVCCV